MGIDACPIVRDRAANTLQSDRRADILVDGGGNETLFGGDNKEYYRIVLMAGAVNTLETDRTVGVDGFIRLLDGAGAQLTSAADRRLPLGRIE